MEWIPLGRRSGRCHELFLLLLLYHRFHGANHTWGSPLLLAVLAGPPLAEERCDAEAGERGSCSAAGDRRNRTAAPKTDGNWSVEEVGKYGFASVGRVDQREELGYDAFVREYEVPRRPVVIRDYAGRVVIGEEKNATAAPGSYEKKFLRQLKELCGKVAFGAQRYSETSRMWAKLDTVQRMTVQDYMKYFKRESKTPKDANALYLFDLTLRDHCPEFGHQMLRVPKYFGKSH